MDQYKQEIVSDLFCDIAETCLRNDLSFWYSHHVQLLEIRKVTITANDIKSKKIAEGSLDSKWHDPEDVLNRILKKVNDYAEGK